MNEGIQWLLTAVCIFLVLFLVYLTVSLSKGLKLYKEAKENSNQYRYMFEQSPDGIAVLVDRTVVYSNRSAALMLDASGPGKLYGRKWFDFVHPGCRLSANEVLEQAEKKCTSFAPSDQKLVSMNGREIDVETTVFSFILNGRITTVCIIRKRHEIKGFNEAAETEKLKTEFFSNMSHEFRTPLNLILSTVQLLELQISKHHSHPEPIFSKYTEVMKQNCYRLLKIVNNLIDVSRIDSGYYELNIANYDIVNFIEDITMSAAVFIKRYGISLIFDTDVEEKVLACDAGKIEKAILNLLSNAAKFTGKGGTITVYLHDAGENVEISIKDTGIGIPPDKIEKIFEKFVQVDKSFTRNNEGTGIGLFLTKVLVEMHNGTISVSSEIGKGSEFKIVLPAVIIPAEDDISSVYTDWCKIDNINVEFSDVFGYCSPPSNNQTVGFENFSSAEAAAAAFAPVKYSAPPK